MRRATLRTTRLSSTTRHVRAMVRASGGFVQCEQLADVEHHEEPMVEAVDATAEFSPRLRQSWRIAFERTRLEAHDLGNLIDQQRVQLAALFCDNGHTRLFGRRFRQFEAAAQIDCRHDAAAQIEAAGYFRMRKWNTRYLVLAKKIADAKDRHAAELIRDAQRDEDAFFIVCRRLGAFHLIGRHMLSPVAPVGWRRMVIP